MFGLEPYVLGEQSVGRMGGGGMMFGLEPYVLGEQSGGRGWWGMTFGLKKGQYSQADLNQSLKMVPKALEPYVLGEQSVGRGGGGEMMFGLEPYVLGEQSVCVWGGGVEGGMTFGLEKGQCSQADLNKSLKMVPKLVNPMF